MSRSQLTAIVATGVLFLGSCSDPSQPAGPVTEAPQPISGQMLTRSLADSPSVRETHAAYRIWRVPFVTNRDTGPSENAGLAFGKTFGAMNTGICDIRVPSQRKRGECDVAPPDSLPDDQQWMGHLLRQETNVFEPSDFYQQILALVNESPGEDVLVFIHGYRVTHRESVCRTAQLAQDMPFNGVTVCFSWPSQGELLKYNKDGGNAAIGPWSLAAFLAELRDTLDDDSRINVLAHSMGNRVLLSALQILRGNIPPNDAHFGIHIVNPRPMFPRFGSWQQRTLPPLEHIVFAAPDVARDKFRETMSEVRPLARHATLYSSAFDFALWSSSVANLGKQRAGDARQLVLIPGLTTIDASGASDADALGHSYYGTSHDVLTDLFYLLKFGQPPDERKWLTKRTQRGKPYWVFNGKPPVLARISDQTRDGTTTVTRW